MMLLLLNGTVFETTWGMGLGGSMKNFKKAEMITDSQGGSTRSDKKTPKPHASSPQHAVEERRFPHEHAFANLSKMSNSRALEGG